MSKNVKDDYDYKLFLKKPDDDGEDDDTDDDNDDGNNDEKKRLLKNEEKTAQPQQKKRKRKKLFAEFANCHMMTMRSVNKNDALCEQKQTLFIHVK